MRYKCPLEGLQFQQCDNISDNFYSIFTAKCAEMSFSQLRFKHSTQLFDSMSVCDKRVGYFNNRKKCIWLWSFLSYQMSYLRFYYCFFFFVVDWFFQLYYTRRFVYRV